MGEPFSLDIVEQSRGQNLEAFRLMKVMQCYRQCLNSERFPLMLFVVITPRTSHETNKRPQVFSYLEGVVQNVAQTSPQSYFTVRVVFKKLQVIGARVEGKLDTVLEIILGKVNVHVQIGKGNLGFNHPKLGQVATGVAVFGTKGRTKRVDIRQGTRVGLHVQLPRDSQVGTARKKVLAVIDGTHHLDVFWLVEVLSCRSLLLLTLHFLLGHLLFLLQQKWGLALAFKT